MGQHPTPEAYIRWMIRRDYPEVYRIELASFNPPWSEDDFVNCLRQNNYCIGRVVEVKETVVGFMIYQLLKSRLRLLSLAVTPEFRRHGIGSAMVQELVNKLSLQRRYRLVVEVRETNLNAQLFLRSNGLRATKILHRPTGLSEDAYVFEYDLRRVEETCR